MKILFLSSTIPNYVADGLFHGLRCLDGVTLVDVPRIDYMYTNATDEALDKTGSRGNTLYHLLQESEGLGGRRTFWQRDLEEYDCIIFSDIYEQCDLFHKIYRGIHPKKRQSLCIVDGYDVPAMFPYFHNSFNLKVRPWVYTYSISKVPYFKREYENASALYGVPKQRFLSLNKMLSVVLQKPASLFPISMSIPEALIQYIPLGNKPQEFVQYNIDEELSELFPERPPASLGKWQPVYENQAQYYQDIGRSKFGITLKRAGWDCLRHYEYTAKGAILCFRDLHKKSPFCAPFELDDTNCIPYQHKSELLSKIGKMSLLELEQIQENQYKWIARYTTRQVAQRFLDYFFATQKAQAARQYFPVSKQVAETC